MKNYTLKILALFIGSIMYGQVGINNANPSAGLDIVSTGNTSSSKALEVNNSSNTEMVTVLDNGNMGIGNTAPTTKLDINNGNTAGAIKIVDGTQGSGKVLTSDANGLATWSATPATALYFFSSSLYNGTTDFKGTTPPYANLTLGPNDRFLTTGTVTNLGPTTPYTQPSQGVSYTIPATGIYRLTLYTNLGYTGNAVGIRAYRGANIVRSNDDSVTNGSSLVMINIWNLEAGDVVLPVSVGNPPPGVNANQLVETTLTVERVN
ncbi:hypothetical protein GCM10022217_11260 [Chryseobacterium ginsenosidimutans]|uniref:hypothetical protein n=1 Tax=Chryseobacterium ginsenosidimutans TaxID=687846 RepID=UPI0031E45933